MGADHISSLFNRQRNNNKKGGRSGLGKSFFILGPGHLLCASDMAFLLSYQRIICAMGFFTKAKKLEICRDITVKEEIDNDPGDDKAIPVYKKVATAL